MPAIVRTMWGDLGPDCRLAKVIQRDVRRRLREESACREHVYVYGRENADYLRKLGRYEVVLVDDDPWPDGCRDVKVHGEKFKNLKRGYMVKHPWHYKWQLMRRAVQDHGRVIYCDWDVRNLVTDIDRAFSLLGDRPFALSAYKYKKDRIPSRPNRRSRRIVAAGNWVYLRGTEFTDRVLAKMDFHDDRWWHDEFVTAHLLDEDHGGWMGEAVWLERYESPIMCQMSCTSPWSILSDIGCEVVRDTPVPFEWTRLFAHIE